MDGIPRAFFVCLTQTRLVSYFYQSNNLVFFFEKKSLKLLGILIIMNLLVGKSISHCRCVCFNVAFAGRLALNENAKMGIFT